MATSATLEKLAQPELRSAQETTIALPESSRNVMQALSRSESESFPRPNAFIARPDSFAHQTLSTCTLAPKASTARVDTMMRQSQLMVCLKLTRLQSALLEATVPKALFSTLFASLVTTRMVQARPSAKFALLARTATEVVTLPTQLVMATQTTTSTIAQKEHRFPSFARLALLS